MKRMAGVAVVAAVLVGGCAAGGDGAQPEAVEASQAQTSPASPAPTTESETASASGLTSRAEMEDWERAIAVGTFISSVRADGGLDAYDDDALTGAGDAACDTMDRGDSIQSVLVTVAGLLPNADSTDVIAGLAGVAAGTLCPEHAGYAG